MRVLIQRVSHARVTVADMLIGEIDRGFLLLVGVTHQDGPADADMLAAKVAHLRVFDDASGSLNRSALDLLGSAGEGVGMLVVSQFTLYADNRRGRRPSFAAAAPPAHAAPLVAQFASALRAFGLPVEEGRFGAEMAVELVNDGPVTIWLDSEDLRS
ncbi:MAG: D-aminoacyl-tRNA deacylase [Chloroflexota bacterium]|nr:D-aminoacyl-tRNA deacylase [Chloroflexota bacterium]